MIEKKMMQDSAASAEKGKYSYSGELEESELEAVAGGIDIFEDTVDAATEVVEGATEVVGEATEEVEGATEEVVGERSPLADITEEIEERDAMEEEVDNQGMGVREDIPGDGAQPYDEPTPPEEELEENKENTAL